MARRLAPFHLWQEEVIEERFRYGKGGSISLAFVRVARLSEPFTFPDAASYGGCRSWVVLPDPPAETSFEPVLSLEEHRARERSLRELLGAPVALVAGQDG